MGGPQILIMKELTNVNNKHIWEGRKILDSLSIVTKTMSLLQAHTAGENSNSIKLVLHASHTLFIWVVCKYPSCSQWNILVFLLQQFFFGNLFRMFFSLCIKLFSLNSASEPYLVCICQHEDCFELFLYA